MRLKYIILISFFIFSACAKELDIEYKNNPDRYAVFEDPDDIYGLSSGLFYNWYKAQYYAYTFSPIMAMWTMADQGTASWTNGGMYELSSEPRVAFNNSEDYSWKKITQSYYASMYANLIQANDIIALLDNGMEMNDNDEDGTPDTEMVKAFAYFNQGITLGYLGLVFDQSFIVTDNPEVGSVVEPSNYKEVVSTACLSLEKCIALCDNNSFEIPDTWINGSKYSNSELSRLAHSFIARLLTYSARNVNENNNTNWAKVLSHAEKGIQRDLAPYIDNTVWKNYFFNYTFNHSSLDWCGIDARIINLMDPNYPKRYPDLSSEPVPEPAVSNDKRLETDFRYDGSCPLKVDRGYYHFFNYEHSRYNYSYSNPTEVIDFSTTENELLIAEAKYRLGDLEGAKSIINSGTRITRGELTPITDNTKILDALFYERDIELLMTGFGIGYFDMRRRNMLQKGTMLHFPIPAKELNVMGIKVYTFGGVENADGINVSNGGWF